jgi:transposase
LRNKGWCDRQVRHEDWGLRHCVLQLRVRKAQCLDCGRYFRQHLPGIQPCQRASEAFRQAIYQQHLDGINRSRLGQREGIGAATVERYFRHGLQRQFQQWRPPRCPPVLGIDEHFFTRRQGYATTLCDLHPRKVYDVVLGRSEIACMWRFTRNNGITEGFHNKMELITRPAYGFRNFENYRTRVKVLCS